MQLSFSGDVSWLSLVIADGIGADDGGFRTLTLMMTPMSSNFYTLLLGGATVSDEKHDLFSRVDPWLYVAMGDKEIDNDKEGVYKYH